MSYQTQTLILISFLFLCACAELNVMAPAAPVYPPEVFGKTGLGGSITLTPSQDLEFTQNAGARPPDFSQPQLTHRGDATTSGEFGIGRRAKVGLGVGIPSSAVTAFFQYQVTGDPAVSAKKKNFPVSGFAFYTNSIGKNEGDQSETFGPGSYPWNGKASLSYYGMGLSLGYRVSDKILLFGGASLAHTQAKAEVSQDQTTDSAGGSYSADMKGQQTSAVLGVRMGHEGSLSLGAQYIKTGWDHLYLEDENSVHFYLRVDGLFFEL